MGEYVCWIPAFGDDPVTTIHAYDAWMAAKQFAARADADSGAEISNGAMRHNVSLRVHVRTPDGVETTWDVTPEATITWYARAAGVVQPTIPASADAEKDKE